MAPSKTSVSVNSFSAFLRENAEEILRSWDEFAATIQHEGTELDWKGLRDHAAQILGTIANDIEKPQSESARVAKSRGEAPEAHGAACTPAEIHADTRIEAGFAIGAMITEYRALRASVLRLWSKRPQQAELRDIDQITRFNEAIDQAIAESVSRYTQQTKKASDLFIGVLGHDIRNPLGTILMATEYLVRSGKLDSASAKPIRKSVERIRVLTEQVVDVTRGQTGRPMPIKRTLLDLGDVATDIVLETRIHHPEANLELQLGDANFVGRWDGSRMGQLFSNLLANAVQYGARDPIAFRLSRAGDVVTATVCNRGPVIPVEDRDRIFDALVRGTGVEETSGRIEGLGLGLYICKEIVLAHGGTISVESDETDGTRFIVTLPVIG